TRIRKINLLVRPWRLGGPIRLLTISPTWQGCRAMHLFISAGEPSGDLHGSNLIRALRQLRPTARFVGYAGGRLGAAGAQLLYPLCKLAVMWFLRVYANLTLFVRLLFRADRYFRHHRPDAVVWIYYPGFHWWLARRAHAHGIPVFYFVPPQLWAWAGWRIRKMRAWVDHILCSLPFEPAWYRERGITAQYFGHPYFDELIQQRLDSDFVERQRSRPGTMVALLPGSRNQEVERNLSTLVRAAIHIRCQLPDTRFLMACYKRQQCDHVERYLAAHDATFIEPHTGRTPEILHLAKVCIAVSGSVSLELLYHGKPSVIVYRTS